MERMSWRDLEAGAPELARLGKERLERVGLALLGTLRQDGSPRISPVEPHVAGGLLLFAAMPRTAKARDLQRDARCTLHSAVSDPDGADGELKLFGRAEVVEEAAARTAAGDAWWASRPERDARVFSLAIEQAVFVSWDPQRGLMSLHRWSRERGRSESERRYP